MDTKTRVALLSLLGYHNTEIAKVLNIAVRTVYNYKHNEVTWYSACEQARIIGLAFVLGKNKR